MSGKMTGIDIGQSEIKLIVVKNGHVKKAVRIETPDNLVENGKITSMDAMASVLRSAKRMYGIHAKKAAIILPDDTVYSRNTTVPAMTASQLAINIPYEFHDYLTEEKSKYFFDYSVREIKYDESGNPNELCLYACAALKRDIVSYRKMLRRAGFRLKVAVPVEYACEKAVKQAFRNDVKDCCVVQIGYTSSRILIYHDGEHQISRVFPVGIADVVSAVSDASGTDMHVSRNYVRTNYNGVLEKEYSKAVYNRIAIEVMKAVNFYNYNNREAMLKDIHLAGGGAGIDILSQEIAEFTGLNVNLVDDILPRRKKNFNTPYMYFAGYGAALK